MRVKKYFPTRGFELILIVVSVKTIVNFAVGASPAVACVRYQVRESTGMVCNIMFS